MNDREQGAEDYRSLLLLDEISRNHELTQRDLSKRLGVALGLVNSYLKNLVSKGYITVSAIPKKRYTYYLTPSGFAEKTRLTLRHLQNFTSLYRVARRDFHNLFNTIKDSSIRRVAFCGADEVTEIAYLSLKEAGLELTAIFDTADCGTFLGFDVLPVGSVKDGGFDAVVITSFGRDSELKEALIKAGMREDRLFSISPEGWLKRIEG